ncbi:hypothetical protein EBU71_01380 [bacterium]|nr:hypothetical protein [Candidatus Elulimicrobium humile]
MPISKIVNNSISKNIELRGTATTLAKGTTEERPLVPKAGDIRFNTSLSREEIYDGSKWDIINPASITTAMSVALGG